MSKTLSSNSFDAVIVGAGFAGLFMLYRLRKLGLSVLVVEAGSGVGGTWFWNRYPGARCDIESMEYSYQFSEELQQEWEWTQRYASQPEILEYLNHVADRFSLRNDIQLNTRVTSAVFDEGQSRWLIKTDKDGQVSANFFIMATGCLSSVNIPDLKGIDTFLGDSYYTGHWPHEDVDFSGKQVGVIGTGSSALQAIPIIAQQAEHLYVFQRTPSYSIPGHNAPMAPDLQQKIKADYAGFRRHSSMMPGAADFRGNMSFAVEATPEQRQQEYEERWQSGGLPFLGAFADLMFSEEANETAAEFVRSKIRGIVKDPDTAEALCPTQVLGCKRLCVDTNYYETYNRANVTLVDISKAAIKQITPTGVETEQQQYTLDSIVFATGFDAMTGAILRVDIRGKSGVTIQEKWEAGPRTYLGLMTAGFPNLFTISGPGSPSVLTNMVPSIEQHVNYIADIIEYAGAQGCNCIETSVDVEDAWVSHVNELADSTLFPSCNSWYLGANIPGKPRVFMPYFGFPQYVEKCNEISSNGYEGFILKK